MGSLRRRRGMAPFAEAWDHSRLAPYVYSNSGNERFLIEISGEALRVLSPDSGEELARFDAQFGEVDSLRWKQINNLLLFTHPACPPCVLKRKNGQWVWEPFTFKTTPWRHSGYTLKQGTDVLQEVNQGYAADGRLAQSGIMHGGEERTFVYGYLTGSNLLSSLEMPNGIVRELSYEQRRDLIAGINCRLGGTVLLSRTQSYDAQERPVARTQQRGTESARNDSFSYNGRNELTAASLGTVPYS